MTEEKRYDHPERPIEYITIQEGWIGWTDGFFCKIEMNGLCVEDFGTTRRSALRYARRAWKKMNQLEIQKTRGYPRRVECS